MQFDFQNDRQRADSGRSVHSQCSLCWTGHAPYILACNLTTEMATNRQTVTKSAQGVNTGIWLDREMQFLIHELNKLLTVQLQ